MDALVQKYYLENNCNCAETVLNVLNDRYGLNLREQDIRLAGGFGGGCGCGLLCGALAGSVAAMGPLHIRENAHSTPGFRENCGALCRAFQDALGGTACTELKPRYFREGTRCSQVVEAAVNAFEQINQT